MGEAVLSLYQRVEHYARRQLEKRFDPQSAWQVVRDVLTEICNSYPSGLRDYGVMFEALPNDRCEAGSFHFSIQFAFEDEEGDYRGMEMVTMHFGNIADLDCEKRCFDLWLENEKSLTKIFEMIENSPQYAVVGQIETYDATLHASPI